MPRPMIWQRVSAPLTRLTAAVLLMGPPMGFMVLESALEPKAKLWPRWQAFNPASREAIDHRPRGQYIRTRPRFRAAPGLRRNRQRRPVGDLL